jgi:hypothetical protein
MCNEFGLTVRRQLVEDHSNVRLSRPRQNPESERQARERLQGGGTLRLRVPSAADLHDNAAPDGVCRELAAFYFPPCVSQRVMFMRPKVTFRQTTLPWSLLARHQAVALGSCCCPLAACSRSRALFPCSSPCRSCAASCRLDEPHDLWRNLRARALLLCAAAIVMPQLKFPLASIHSPVQ